MCHRNQKIVNLPSFIICVKVLLLLVIAERRKKKQTDLITAVQIPKGIITIHSTALFNQREQEEEEEEADANLCFDWIPSRLAFASLRGNGATANEPPTKQQHQHRRARDGDDTSSGDTALSTIESSLVAIA